MHRFTTLVVTGIMAAAGAAQATGEIKWDVHNDAPRWSGVMTTAGGLVFFGTPQGEFIALDEETGEKLWSFQTGSGVVGQPVTLEQDGEQYVSIVSGWGGAVPLRGGEVAKKVNDLNQDGMVRTFRLPKRLAAAEGLVDRRLSEPGARPWRRALSPLTR